MPSRRFRPVRFWSFVATGVLLSALILLIPSESTRALLQNLLGLAAAAAAVAGMLRNRPDHAGVWRLLVVAVVLFAAADVAFDVVRTGVGNDHSMLSQLVYLPAYPLLALALYRLAIGRFRRDTAIDGAIVAVAVSAAIWQWVVMPVLTSSSTETMDRIAAIAYPALDIALVVVVIHATAWLPRRMTAAWLLFSGTALVLAAAPSTHVSPPRAATTKADSSTPSDRSRTSSSRPPYCTRRCNSSTTAATAALGATAEPDSWCSASPCSARPWSCSWTTSHTAIRSRSRRSSRSVPRWCSGASRNSSARPTTRATSSPRPPS